MKTPSRAAERVVRFHPSETTVIEAGGRRFFELVDHARRRWVVDARCRHRGGPLDKAELCSGGKALRCPWHDCTTPLRRLKREALPSVFRPGSAATVLAEPSDAVRLLRPGIAANPRLADLPEERQE